MNILTQNRNVTLLSSLFVLFLVFSYFDIVSTRLVLNSGMRVEANPIAISSVSARLVLDSIIGVMLIIVNKPIWLVGLCIITAGVCIWNLV